MDIVIDIYKGTDGLIYKLGDTEIIPGWIKECKEFCWDASDLYIKSQLPKRIIINNHNTTKHAIFILAKSFKDDEGEITHWEYTTNTINSIKLTLLND